jgi:hypothetical protein
MKIIVHSMNGNKARRLLDILPEASYLPIATMTKTNAAFNRLKRDIDNGFESGWPITPRKMIHSGDPDA